MSAASIVAEIVPRKRRRRRRTSGGLSQDVRGPTIANGSGIREMRQRLSALDVFLQRGRASAAQHVLHLFEHQVRDGQQFRGE